MNDLARVTLWNRRRSRAPEELLTWLTRHGIDPRRVPNDSVIVADFAQHRIIYTRAVVVGEGRLLVAPDELITETAVVQLEAGPLPIPQHPDIGVVRLHGPSPA